MVRANRPRVLIVEDELLIAQDLQTMLEDNGYEVAGIARDFGQVKKAIQNGHVDVAVVDVQLRRGPDGVAVAQWLRQEYDIPSLFVSGRIGDAVVTQALAARPIGFVDKPYSETWLIGPLHAATGMQSEGLSI
ncbi:response regulator [Aurantimonas sp. A2-1-M11]|uniref:response regulator n=1 Tax=Aurantimonas sp. A2-1-M11 TaxID=3113712 RepID=UPI002F9313E0